MTHAPAFLEHAGRHVAFEHVEGHTPGVVFLGGFKSSMRGLKSQALYDWCCNNGIAFTRLDYAGHGESSGEFTEFHLGDWLDDALAVFDTLPHEQSIVVGSSMGGWLAVLLAVTFFSKCRHASSNSRPSSSSSRRVSFCWSLTMFS